MKQLRQKKKLIKELKINSINRGGFMKHKGLTKVAGIVMSAMLAFSAIPIQVNAEATIGGGKTILEMNASTLPDGNINADKIIDDFVTLKASNEKQYTVDANNKKSADGSLIFTKRLKSNGASDNNGRSIYFYAPAAGKAVVYMLSANSTASGRKLALYNEDLGIYVDGQAVVAATSAGDGGAITPAEYTIDEAGFYSLRCSDGINVYYFRGEFNGEGEAPDPRPTWNKVKDPVINSVAVNEDGYIDVDVTMEVGRMGADTAKLFLMQDGFEVTTIDITGSGVYTFEPNRAGDFTVHAEAYRPLNIDKVSNEVELKNYELPLTKPEVTWARTRKDGSVYLDWNDIGADTYEVAYLKVEDTDVEVVNEPNAVLETAEASETQDKHTEEKEILVANKYGDDNAYTVAGKDITEEAYTITGLEKNATYYVRVSAKKGDKSSKAYSTITVGDGNQQWYVAAIGSGTSGEIAVDDAVHIVKSAKEPQNASDVTNTSAKVNIASQTNGKIADSEDGFFYYYTKIDPNTENFKLTATFTVNDVKDGPDNQTGYGIYATDMAGIGSKDTKYFNSVAVGQFKMSGNGYHANGARRVTGYTSYDATNPTGDERKLDATNVFSVANDGDDVQIGDKVTYTLEKVNSGYVCSMEGASDTIVFDGADVLTKQESDSLCIGVVVARKVGVEISDIKFEISEGAIEGEAVILEEPKFKLYSGDTTSSLDYEFIASANCDGTLSIKTAKGAEVATSKLEANKIFRASTELKIGDNNYTYEFTPDSSFPDLSNYEAITGDKTVNVKQWGVEGETIYVSPNGAVDAIGTKEAPLDVQTALSYAQPGQVIVMTDGIYTPDSAYTINRSVNGREDAMITLMAENPGSVTVNGSRLTNGASLIDIVGSYWHVYGIEFTNCPVKGVSVCGNHNIVEMCTIHDVGNSGLQISRYSGEPNDDEMWPSYNLIKNCEAYDCCDVKRNDADGFAAKLTCGEGNKFYGCISHHNIDDGWDLYAKSTTGSIGAVTIENCVAYSNGFLTTEDPEDPNTEFGEGNGFKLGGENMYGGHKLINSVSYNNYAKGITSNSCPDVEVYNCTSYNNSLNGSAYNLSLYTRASNEKKWIVDGTICLATNGKCIAELGASTGVIYSLRSGSNYFFDGTNVCNSVGAIAGEDWFLSTDVSIVPTRNDDGTINMHDLLVKEGALHKSGATIDTESDDAKSIQPQITTVVSKSVTKAKKSVAPIIFIVVAILACAAVAVVASKSKKKVK